jgi:crotonobetainyl-CoA:carnitine CoA-transferase CaiB-like acyl-CoA transferase
MIVDLTQILSGPYATMLLGDMGAKIIKIERVGQGDRTRHIDPSPKYFDTVNRNKQSVAVDLKTEEGQEVVRNLLDDADVLVENMKSGRMEKFNLDYKTVSDSNPELIYCSISGFGSNSPYEDQPALDLIPQAMAGVMSITGYENSPPVWSGLQSGDLSASMFAVQGILGALFAREAGHIEGEWMEIPMLDATASWVGPRASYTFGTGQPFPRGRYPPGAPGGVFECKDGYVALAAIWENMWQRFCAAIDRRDLLEDEAYQTKEDRSENEKQLRAEIESVLTQKPAEHWIETLREYSIPVAPIYDTLSMWEDPHMEQRELHKKMTKDGGEDADVVDNPFYFLNMDTRLDTPPQDLGASSERVLRRYGYSEDEIDELRDRDIIG